MILLSKVGFLEAKVTDIPGTGRTVLNATLENPPLVAAVLQGIAETTADGVRFSRMFRPWDESRAPRGHCCYDQVQRVPTVPGEPTSPEGPGFATGARNGTVRDAERAKQANFAKPPDSGSAKNGGRLTAIQKAT